MCGRFNLIDWDGVEQRFLLSRADMGLIAERIAGPGSKIPPWYNIAPTQDVLVVTNRDGQNRPELMRWGLVPFWAKDPSIGNRMINARAETLAERPSFRNAFRRRRCLVIADGFFEWTGQGKDRRPLRIGLASGELFAFAGLWEAWKRPDESWLLSCAIVTKAADEFMAPIHDRMPVILDPESEDLWLDPQVQDAAALSELLAGRSGPMDAYEVSRVVNSPANDVPECIAPLTRMV